MKPEGEIYNMHMLRDLDFSFLMKKGDNKKFQLIAVRVKDGDSEKGRDVIRRAYEVIKSGGLGVSTDVYKIVEWRLRCDDLKDFGKDNEKWEAHSGFKTKFWIHWMANRHAWYCANPNIQIRTSKLVDVLVE